MDLQWIKTFLTVLEVGNYSNAAIRLDYSQSTITSHIQKLENAYGGIKLLERKGNLMIPTASGETLKKYANELMELYDKSKKEIMKTKLKAIRIGTINSLSNIYLPLIIQKIRSIYPDINIQLFNGTQTLLYTMLKENALDMMFIIDTLHEFKGFKSQQIRKEKLVIVANEDHPLTSKPSLCFDDIKDENFILSEYGCNYRNLLLDEFSKNNYEPKIAMELGSIEAVKQAILDKWGIGFLPSFLIKPSDSLIQLEFKSSHKDFYSQVIYTENEICSTSFIKKIINMSAN
ncbi:LysR family transcriptional regulator [Clostridium zeae]|uniref:LysR family transcriptional regulator n=1 Tax=Clostridium zeae TaxID=2759022 RepID=A0ABQ1E649_9CLOT|nr:LysR family transcriptional regulator [Clostridium zeae]GFZ30219.1 LysR family transcriptional regulator [Clostridium zeae]